MKWGKGFLRLTLINAVIIFAGLSLYWLVWDWLAVNGEFLGYRAWLTWAVYSFQAWSGVPVELSNATMMTYALPEPGFNVEIITLCLGIGEMLFFTFLVVLFRGPSLKNKCTGLAIFLPVIFLINFLRILMLYPMANWFGIDAMWDIHWHLWKYGMFLVLMGLFSVWYMFFAKKDLERRLF